MVQNRKIERKCVDFPGNIFKPQAIPLSKLENINLTKEELTAVYYSDYLGLRQTEAAQKMEISQASFSRDLAVAHKKIASALFEVKALFFTNEPLEDK
ncbi:MAG: DUF134 domain-containing protein [Candidatus Heimdallarchaeota archaeon]|nr:DUF134 domain-containing protein [Candidatus Heimdallarchaeota archaeon]